MRCNRHPLAAVVVVILVVVFVIIVFSDDLKRNDHHNHYLHLHPDGGGLAAAQHQQVREDVQNLPLPGTANDSSAQSGSLSNALLRILILTYNRGASLTRCLESLNAAEYDGYRVTVDIHIDRGKNNRVNNGTLRVANSFVFKHGPVQVHVQPRHAGVVGQWMGTWRVPRDNTSEIALFVEDDITLSPYFARWLRRVHSKYDSYPGINGYALQAESMRHATGAKGGMLKGPPGQVAFLYPVLGSWGFSPHTGQWRDFIRWHTEASHDPKFIPFVPGLKPSGWYRSLQRQGRGESMWTMWHIYHAYQNHLYTVYTNLPEGKGLAFNWKEPGEHYSKNQAGKNLKSHLLDTWNEEQLRLPNTLFMLDAKGETMEQKTSATGVVSVKG